MIYIKSTKNSDLPFAILIIGVGDADFESMHELDGDDQRLTWNVSIDECSQIKISSSICYESVTQFEGLTGSGIFSSPFQFETKPRSVFSQ